MPGQRSLSSLVALTALLASPAVQAADPANGHAIAKRWCQSCHIVDGGKQPAPSSDAPPFPTLAADPKWTPQRLTAFLQAPHGPMPKLELSNYDIDDLVAHIESLKAH
jgi:mono/diheme cytochrome c family protein